MSIKSYHQSLWGRLRFENMGCITHTCIYIYIIIIYIQNHKISIDIIGIDIYIYTKNFKDVKRSPEFGLYPVSNKHVMDRVDPNNPDTRVMKLGVNRRKGETSSFPPCGNHLPIVL